MFNSILKIKEVVQDEQKVEKRVYRRKRNIRAIMQIYSQSQKDFTAETLPEALEREARAKGEASPVEEVSRDDEMDRYNLSLDFVYDKSTTSALPKAIQTAESIQQRTNVIHTAPALKLVLGYVCISLIL